MLGLVRSRSYPVPRPRQQLAMLAAGRVDVALLARGNAESVLAKGEAREEDFAPPLALSVHVVRLWVHQRQLGSSASLRLSSALESMRASGELARHFKGYSNA
jgi:ABC-type amino acid transport substrate-binding protein